MRRYSRYTTAMFRKDLWLNIRLPLQGLGAIQARALAESPLNGNTPASRRVAIRWRSSPTKPLSRNRSCPRSITRLIQGLCPRIMLADADRAAAKNAMRVTADKRVEGILEQLETATLRPRRTARGMVRGVRTSRSRARTREMGRRRASIVLASSRVLGGIDAGVCESRIGSGQLTRSKSSAAEERLGLGAAAGP